MLGCTGMALAFAGIGRSRLRRSMAGAATIAMIATIVTTAVTIAIAAGDTAGEPGLCAAQAQPRGPVVGNPGRRLFPAATRYRVQPGPYGGYAVPVQPGNEGRYGNPNN